MYEEQPGDYDLKFSDTIARTPAGLFRFDMFSRDDEGNIIASVRKVVPRSGFSVVDEPIVVDKKLIDWKYPELGWFNSHRQAFFCYRNTKNPHAKYKKGFSLSSIITEYTPKDHLGMMVKEQSYTLVHYIFNPEYFQFEKAVDLLRKGKRYSVALDNKYALVVDFDKKYIGLYRNMTCIGFLTKEDVVAIPGISSFMIEDIEKRSIKVVIR